MSKELTEQWRNGTLPQGYYYIVANTEQKHKAVFYLPERKMEYEARLELKDQFVLEVLAKVPTYDQFVELIEKVEEQEWHIEELEQQNAFECECNKEYADTLKKNEQLEKQLKEAEEALKDFCDDCTLPKCGCCDEDCAGWKANQYLEKYGVENE